MPTAKDIRIAPIPSADANRIVRAVHYSGKIVQNSQVHLGVFLNGKCGGAMQFGPSMDKRRLVTLVSGTKWNEFIELNRLALADWLPRNSESRALAVSFRLLRKAYPWLKWVLSFADATQCGDGTIYRAAGFVLTAIKKNTQILRMPDGSLMARKTLDDPNHTAADGRFGSAAARDAGAVPLPGFQLRYIYFLKPDCRSKLTVPEIPYSRITELGAGMYRGQPRGGSIENDATGTPAG